MDVSKQIREARKKMGLTQRELASLAGVATITIQQYELGKREPRYAQLELIAKALGMVPDTPLFELEECSAESAAQEELLAAEKEIEYLRGMVAAYEKILGKVMPDAHA